MKKLMIALLVFTSAVSNGQNVQTEIDEQVWIPFTKAWESNDAQAYNELHTDDVWRITPAGFTIGEEYKKSNVSRMRENREQRRKRIIEFWFENRLSNGTSVYEVGYYRITDNTTKEVKYYYGRFHIGLKKVNGRWKINQDWDTSNINGVAVTAEDYAKGKSRHFE